MCVPWKLELSHGKHHMSLCQVSCHICITEPSSLSNWLFILRISAWCNRVSVFSWQVAFSSSWNCCCVARASDIRELVVFVSIRDCCVLSGRFGLSVLWCSLVGSLVLLSLIFVCHALSVLGGWKIDWVFSCGGCLIDAGAIFHVVAGLRPFIRSRLWLCNSFQIVFLSHTEWGDALLNSCKSCRAIFNLSAGTSN